MKNIPDWVAVVLLLVSSLGGLAGGYAALTTTVDEHDRRIEENSDYSAFLQEQHDNLKERVVKAEVKVSTQETAITEFKAVVHELVLEIRGLREEMAEERGRRNG